MSEYSKYRRTQIGELRPVTEADLAKGFGEEVSVSIADINNGSPKLGDMIARNPKNHEDKWLVAEKYFKDNFEEISNGEPLNNTISWVQSRLEDATSRAEKWYGTDTTYGDLERNASDVYFGMADAYEDILDDLLKIKEATKA